ncbi:MAG TPA: DoxX family protein [Gemmatimonas aurantiaca]|uniref:DoxX family protein n=1 Tax=Gemmatimonas aurantiaca TaxID=173480 RepID=A0A3D4VCG2_9BACT|nr:DoxX family protein [Gemmatimonas aurantiaca]HCT58820.1 DoxX family protein [Gemmatimonas aurantiaca]
MSRVRSLLRLEAVALQPDLALLLLRVWFGLSLCVLHGWGKIGRLSADPVQFADPFGLGMGPSLALAAAAEVVGALMVVIGLATRWAALGVIVTMATAFFFAHGGKLTGEGNGEMPFLFLGAFLAIFLAGPGRFSVDDKLK